MDDIGIFEEAQRRTRYYSQQNETLRRKILGGGPPRGGGPTAQPVNPFDEPRRLPTPAKPPYWRLHSESRMRRRLYTLRDDLDVNPLQIVQAVCSVANISAAQLLGDERKRDFSWPRQVAIYFVARYSDLSLTQMGYVFHRDHSTIMHSIWVVPRRIDQGNSFTRLLVDEVEARLRQIK